MTMPIRQPLLEIGFLAITLYKQVWVTQHTHIYYNCVKRMMRQRKPQYTYYIFK